MPQEKIIIKFSAKGDRALIGAIKQLDIATKRLQDKTSLYEKELKKLGLQQTKVNNGTVLGTRNNRLLANSFATLRSKLLLVSFAATMAAKPLFQLVKAQSDAEEIAIKFNVVFGNQTDIVREWANALGTSVGRAGSELEFMLSTLQDTFVPLGFSREAATQLSTSLTQLALDVASFNNKADSDVIRDFQSALVGNHETVRKYGIVMTEASLQAEAFNSGIIGTKRELTASEKVQARLNILYEGSKDAIGDLDRTQDSFANTLKRFNAEVLIARQELGLELMPVARDLLVIMSGLVSHFKDTAVLKGYATALGAVGIAMSAARIHALGFAASITTLKVAAAKTGIALLFIGVGELAARMLYAKDQTAGLNKEFDDLDEKLKQLLKGEGGVDNLSSAELDLIEIEKQLAEIYKKRAKLTEDVEKAQKALNDEIARQEEKRLTEKRDTFKAGTQAFIDANNELLDFQQQSDQKSLKLEEDLGEAKEGQLKEISSSEAKTLLKQLGGNRFMAMTGAKDFGIGKDGLHFKIGRNAKSISHVVINLSSMDLYDIKFLRVRAGKITVVKKLKGVYADQLGTMFKKYTGMNVRL